MIQLNKIKVGDVLEYKDQPHEVLKAQHSQRGRGGAMLRVKLRNLISGSVINETFKGDVSLQKADIRIHPGKALFKENGDWVFMDNSSYEQITLSQNQIGEKAKFLVPQTEIKIVKYEGQPLSIELPPKVTMEVKDAPPGVKGDSAQNPTKEITLENDLKIDAPLFVEEGEKVIVDTRDKSYVEKAKE